MRSTILLTLAVAVFPAAGQAQVTRLEEQPVPDSVRAELLGVLTSYCQALSDRDWDRFETHFWPGATISTIWQPSSEDAARVVVSTVPQFVEQAPEGPGSKEIFEERMLAMTVHGQANLATAFARYKARFGDPGEVMEWEGIDSFSLLRHGNEWRILALSFAADE